MKTKLFTLLIALLLSGCYVNHGTYTVISNQIADLDNINLETTKKVRNIEGVSDYHIIIFIPIGDMNPNVESAMADALKTVDGDLFTNASIHSSFFYIPYIYGRGAVTIEGDVIKTRK